MVVNRRVDKVYGAPSTQVPGCPSVIIHEYSWGLQAHKYLGVLQILYMSIPWGSKHTSTWVSFSYYTWVFLGAPSTQVPGCSSVIIHEYSWGLQAHKYLGVLQLLYMSIPGGSKHTSTWVSFSCYTWVFLGAPSTQVPGCPSVIIHEYSWGLQAHKYLGVLQLLYMSIPWGSKHTSTWLSFSYYTWVFLGAPSTQVPGCPSVIIHEYSWGLQARKYLGVLQLL